MAIDDIAEQFFTYENRLASFKVAHPLPKRRGSSASSKTARSIKWPHKTLRPEDFAKAGFFYHPSADKPDNVACFLCHRGVDEWDKEDDPLVEHLKLSPDCGWAIVEAVEAQIEEFVGEYPASKRLLDARKATFANQWPHEGKKGWKCKTKQLADAGWRYTPTNESDDLAMCNYCQLSLDGWENSDKPLDEHYKRSEDCAFFTLIDNHSKAPPPKKAKAKRGSKASRLSTQSQFTTTSEAPSFLESPAEEGDSILTTATNTTSKKMAKAKKAPAKPRATRAKKEAPVEVVVALEPEDDDFTVKVAPKATRGKKRKSEEDIDPTPVEIAPPPAKRRTTRTRGSIAVDNSTLMTDDDTSQLVSAPKAKKGRASTRGKRNISNASAAKIDTSVPNDEDIDAALEADLEGRLTDDEAPAAEDVIMIENIEPIEGPSNPDHHMFGTESANIDEAAIEAELKAMEAESKPLPKAKGSKARQPRKVSAKQQATAKKAAAVQARAEAEAEAQRVAEYEASVQIASELEQSISLQHSGEDSVDSIASQSTVVKGGASRLKNSTKTTQKGKNVADDEVQMIDHKAQETLTVETDEPRTTKSLRVQDRSMTEDDFFTPGPEESLDEMIVSTPKFVNHHTSRVVEDAASSTSAVEAETHVPSKINGKGKAKVVVESPKSTTPPPLDTTPSQSPQSSDAENHPPSSKPSAASRVVATPATARRVPLGTVTPTMSPSKRNIIAGLQTLHPWTGVDLDSVFTQSPGGYNISVNTDAIFGKASVKNGLTSPEKQMTVDEWIHYNAQMAEEKLKAECERMVSNFENQGTRAMMALEGIECLE